MEKYFSVWSVAFIVIACFFLFLTRKAWGKKIREMKWSFRKSGLDASSSQEQSTQDTPDKVKALTSELDRYGISSKEDLEKLLNAITENLDKKDKEIKRINDAFEAIYSFFETYKFNFLNYFLVPNSKLALVWFSRQPSTKDNFDMNFDLQSSAENLSAEKAAILNALLTHSLLSLGENNQYSVTPHGMKFLKMINLI